MNKYISRLTSSARGEDFNILSWLFLLPTFFCGLAFIFIDPLGLTGTALLMAESFDNLIPHGAVVWGVLAVLNIILGATFLLFRWPPVGKTAGLVGFMLWVWAGFSFIDASLYLLTLVLALPQCLFWVWQYFALARFKREDALDKQTMDRYDGGDYDNKEHPKDSKIDREDNRGVDRQSFGSYDEPDNGGDSTRALDTD